MLPPPNDGSVLLRVRYAESDQMGVVYYGNYFTWLEMGRTELLRWSGSSYRKMEAEGFMLPVIEATCRYKSPARYDDIIRIRTQVLLARGARIHFGYSMTHELEGRLIAEGETKHAFTTLKMKPVRPPDWLARLFTPLIGADAEPS